MAIPSAPPGGRPWPNCVAALDPGERLLVWSMRQWLAGWAAPAQPAWQEVWNEFAGRFGGREGRLALAAFTALLGRLRTSARRPLRDRCADCPSLGAEEISVLRLVAACQRRQQPLAQGIALWLAPADETADIVAAATRLAAVLTRHELLLPDRAWAPVPTAAPLRPRVAPGGLPGLAGRDVAG